ncbi:MAG: hypothetical protein ABEJ78_12405 [Haloferacaceae archaeon]
MSRGEVRHDEDGGILHRHAVRTPLPNEAAERAFHENIEAVAAARERKADLLTDPGMTVAEAYETEVELIAETFRRRLRHVAGDDYERVARAYHRGERSDRLGALTAYYVEGIWRMQQRPTVTDVVFCPLILRYPDSFTINLRFLDRGTTPKSVYFESPQHASTDVDERFSEQYYDESRYEQARAAEYLRETAEILREEFPDPAETSFEERKYGGIVSAEGRHGSEFSELLTRATPDPDRFSESVGEATLVDAGPEARRTEREFLRDVEVGH